MGKRKIRFKKETHFGGRLQNISVRKIRERQKLNTSYDRSSIRFALHHLKVGHRISPPVVERIGRSNYRVVDGSHRLMALRRYGAKRIRVEVT